MITRLMSAVDGFILPTSPAERSLWERLSLASGTRPLGTGSPVAKSRPPVTLAVVALVMDVTGAAREGAVDLSGRAVGDAAANLRAITGALAEGMDHGSPDLDLIGWWTDAVMDWTSRARTVLGQGPTLRALRGAECPHCGASIARVRQEGEWWLVPAIAVTWIETAGDDMFSVHALHCRGCGAEWLRGVDLDYLIRSMITTNISSETLALP